MQAIISMCQTSLEEKTGITFYFQGQSIPMVVRRMIGTEAVEGFNQEFGKILIRLDCVYAVATQ